MSSLDLVSVIRRRWPLIAFCTIASILLAMLYHVTAARQYESQAKILVMKKNPAMTSMSGGQTSDVQREVVDDVLATHMELATSMRVVENAIKNRQLDELPGIQESLDEETTAADYIREQLRASRGGMGEAKGAQVLSISFIHGEAAEAQTVLSAIVESYQDFLGSTFQDVSSQAVQLIQKAKDELGDDLDKEEAEYAEFREKSPLLFSGNNTIGLNERKLLELETKRVELELQRSMLQSRLALVRNALEGDDAGNYTDHDRLALIDDEHVQRLSLLVNVERGNSISESFQASQPARSEAASAEYDRILDLRTQEQAMRTRLGPNHPKLAEVKSAIAEMTSFIKSQSKSDAFSTERLDPSLVINAYVSLLENDLVNVDYRLEEIETLVTVSHDKAKQLDVIEMRDQVLLGRLQRKRELYDAVLSRIRELSMVGDYGGYITEVISPVSKAEKVWPSLITLLTLGTVLGLVSGSGIATAAHLLDKTFESTDQIKQALGAPLFGIVPQFAGANEGIRKIDENINDTIVTVQRPKSRDAEAIRSIRTALFFAAVGQKHQVIQVTSPTPGDGKSLLSANLAVSLASANKRTLLVDADLRRPTQHDILGVRSEPGLSELLIDKCELTDAICSTSVENLDVLPCGSLPPNPAELLAMPEYSQVIDTVREKYDYVIVDSPPVLVVSDPLNSASAADGMILVVPVRKHHATACLRAKELIESSNTNLLGVVVNDMENRLVSQGERYGKYGYGRYGYGYVQGSRYLSNGDSYYEDEQPLALKETQAR